MNPRSLPDANPTKVKLGHVITVLLLSVSAGTSLYLMARTLVGSSDHSLRLIFLGFGLIGGSTIGRCHFFGWLSSWRSHGDQGKAQHE